MWGCYFVDGTAGVGPLGGGETLDVLVFEETQGGQSEPQRRGLKAVGRAAMVLLQFRQRQDRLGDAGLRHIGPLLRQRSLKKNQSIHIRILFRIP